MKRCWSFGCTGLILLVLALTISLYHWPLMDNRSPCMKNHSSCPIQTSVMLAPKPFPAQQLIEGSGLVASRAPNVIQNWTNALNDLNSSDPIPEEREQLVRRWAEEQPAMAADWAEKQLDPAVRYEALNQVALAWAESDLSKAVAWATHLPSDDVKPVIIRNLGYEVARTGPVEALALAATLSPGHDRDDLQVHAVSQWADTDALAATKWACTITELALRERVLASIAAAVADQSPETAVILTTQSLWPGESQKRAAMAIVQRWAQQDPKGAAAWVQQFPAGELKNTALRNLIAVWSHDDAEAPAAWLNSLPEATMRSIGADALAIPSS